MRACVQHDLDPPSAVALHDYVVFAHVAQNEVAMCGYLAFMGQKKPRLGKYPFYLNAIEFWIRHHP
jgi:hypothetical protein